MNRFASILVIAVGLPISAPAVEWGLPWFHTRPKPVVLDDQTAKPVSQKTIRRTEFGENTSDQAVRPAWTDSSRTRPAQRRDRPARSDSSRSKEAGATIYK
jgi:hypothetical protein